MSDWAYLAIAYTVVWGALAGYALLMARRVSQATEIDRRLEHAISDGPEGEQDTAICDAPPAP